MLEADVDQPIVAPDELTALETTFDIVKSFLTEKKAISMESFVPFLPVAVAFRVCLPVARLLKLRLIVKGAELFEPIPTLSIKNSIVEVSPGLLVVAEISFVPLTV